MSSIVCFQIEEDAYQDDLGFSLGTLGKSKTSGIRGPQIDSKTKARISKTLHVSTCFLYSKADVQWNIIFDLIKNVQF